MVTVLLNDKASPESVLFSKDFQVAHRMKCYGISLEKCNLTDRRNQGGGVAAVHSKRARFIDGAPTGALMLLINAKYNKLLIGDGER